MKKPVLFLLAVALCTSSPARAAEGHDLDISQYRETFSETFRGQLDASPWGPSSKWITHTPWAGDFGDARFSDPQPGFPFITGPGGLKITARKDINGKWASGLLCSSDGKGHGFTQAGGYFEARMKMPPGPGVWPAFWLVGPGDDDYKAEIDIVEYYGHAPDRYQITLHQWPKSKDVKGIGAGDTVHVPDNALTSTFHTYGVEILDNEIVFYLDRHEIKRFPSAPAFQTPMEILVNLALGSGWPIDQTPNPSVLEVDYVKAFKRKTPQP